MPLIRKIRHLAFSVFVLAFALEGSQLGRVLSLKGMVFINNQLTEKRLSLPVGSIVETQNGHAVIEVGDGKIIALDQNSRLRIVSLDEKIGVVLERGKIRGGLSLSDKNFSGFDLVTPAGKLTVPQGRFLAQVDPKESNRVKIISLDSSSHFEQVVIEDKQVIEVPKDTVVTIYPKSENGSKQGSVSQEKLEPKVTVEVFKQADFEVKVPEIDRSIASVPEGKTNSPEPITSVPIQGSGIPGMDPLQQPKNSNVTVIIEF